MVIVRVVDFFWSIEPSFRQRAFYVHWMDLLVFAGVGGVWLSVFLLNLKSRPLLPLHDPRVGYQPLEAEAEHV